MVLTELIGKEVIHKGNKCKVLAHSKTKQGTNALQLEMPATEKTPENPWVEIDECRIDVYFTQRPRLFGVMVDCYDGVAKCEWQNANGKMLMV